MEEFVTPTPPVGEVSIVRENLHGVAVNALVTSYKFPDNWFFRQFPSKEAVQEWALQNNLTFVEKEKRSGDDNQSE